MWGRDEMNEAIAHGAFDERHMRRKMQRWVVDDKLVAAFIATIPSGSTLWDLGAGGGRYVKALEACGYLAMGIDGSDIENAYVFHRDLTSTGMFHGDLEPREWAISIEVGEHIQPPLCAAFLANLVAAATVGLIVSWAVPGQRGRGHVHCRLPEWVVWTICSFSPWCLDHDWTVEARRIAGKGWDRKLLVFRK